MNTLTALRKSEKQKVTRGAGKRAVAASRGDGNCVSCTFLCIALRFLFRNNVPFHSFFFCIDFPFFLFFRCAFLHITHTPRLCVCSGSAGNQATDQTRPVPAPAAGLFVQLSVCTAVSPSLLPPPLSHLAPFPLHVATTAAAIEPARFVYCYSHQCWTRVLPVCLLCHGLHRVHRVLGGEGGG